MPCKACHKPKPKAEKLNLVQGKYYLVDGDKTILARVGVNEYNFISLRDGNRWFESFNISDVTSPYYGSVITEAK